MLPTAQRKQGPREPVHSQPSVQAARREPRPLSSFPPLEEKRLFALVSGSVPLFTQSHNQHLSFFCLQPPSIPNLGSSILTCPNHSHLKNNQGNNSLWTPQRPPRLSYDLPPFTCKVWKSVLQAPGHSIFT